MQSGFKLLLIIMLISIESIAVFGQKEFDDNILWTAAWSSDGEYIALGGAQNDLKIFNGYTLSLIKTYPFKDVIISRVKWHPHKHLLAIATQSTSIKTVLLDLDKEQWIHLEELGSSLRGLDWNSTGDLLAVSEFEGEVSVFTDKGELISRFDADPKSVTGIDWHPHKNIMATVGMQIGLYSHLGDTIRTWLPGEEEVLLLCVEWHKSGEFFAVGDYGDIEHAENKMIQYWNNMGEELQQIEGSKGEYRNIRWSPDGNMLAGASDALRIWTKDGVLVAESASSEDYLWGLDWSPDGNRIITSSAKGKIFVWDSDARVLKELEY
jgi:WD40 repeat protein